MSKIKRHKRKRVEMGYFHFLKPNAGKHHTRTVDVRKGRSRKPKHKNRDF